MIFKKYKAALLLGLFLYSTKRLYSHIFKRSYIFNHYKKIFCVNRLIHDGGSSLSAVLNLLNRRPFEYAVVGLDCEYVLKSNLQEPALLQLANPDGYCAIFQLKMLEQIPGRDPCDNDFINSLRETPGISFLPQIMDNASVLKVGVAVLNDAKYLNNKYKGLITRSCLDIRHLAVEVGIRPGGLNYLAEHVLGINKIKLLKSKRPWDHKFLTSNQIEYAALDARLGVDIFLALNDIEICRRYSWFRRLFWDRQTYWNVTLSLWQKYINKPFVFSKHYKLSNRTIYWFEKIQYLPYSIKFWPGIGMIIPESAYEISRRCAVCGKCRTHESDHKTQIMVKSVVPIDYDIETFVTTTSTDIHFLDLCNVCLIKSQKVDFVVREYLTKECGVPPPNFTDSRIKEAKVIANLLMKGPKTNSDEELIKRLFIILGLDLQPCELTSKILEIALTIDCLPNSDHGMFVVQYYKQFYNDGEKRLFKLWISTFVSVMLPKHIPRTWYQHDLMSMDVDFLIE